MHRLYDMKNCLISAAQSQMGNLQDCNAEELGEVIDMIKDLEEDMIMIIPLHILTILELISIMIKAMNLIEKESFL